MEFRLDDGVSERSACGRKLEGHADGVVVSGQRDGGGVCGWAGSDDQLGVDDERGVDRVSECDGGGGGSGAGVVQPGSGEGGIGERRDGLAVRLVGGVPEQRSW